MAPLAKSKTAPSQPAQPSRKGKKAWRKNVDIATVTRGLETLREEIIQHGRPLGDLEGNELFAVDTVGTTKEDVGSKKKIKVLKMDEILGRRSAVPALEGGRNKRPREEKTGDGLTVAKKQKVDWVSKKDVARLRNNLEKKSHLDVENIDSADAPSLDLWDDPTTTSTQPTSTSTESQQRPNEYIPQPQPKVAPSTLRRPPISLTQSGQPTPSIPTPAAAHSYNPTFEDWDAQLTSAGLLEIEAERRRLALQQKDAEKQARISALAAQPDRPPGEDAESEWEGFETEAEDAENNLTASEMKKRKRPERKTPAERNKLKRRKEAERLTKHESRMRDRRARDEATVKSLILSQTSTITTTTDPSTSLQPLPTSHPETTTPTTLRRNPTLGPSRALIPPVPLEILLPSDLQDTLRRLKPEGNLLTDRFRNLLVNGKLEARRKTTYAASRKRQVKVTEKWWSKDFQIGA